MSMSQSKEKTSDVGDAGLEIQTAYRTGMAASEPLGEGGTAWLQVLGAFCLNMNTWGLLSSYGVYQTYYSLHLLRSSSSSSISWIGSTQGFLMFLFSFLIGPIFDAGHLKSLLRIGTFLSTVGFFMTSLCFEYWQCFLAQGVMMGIGFGCLYLPAPALVSMHFEKHPAFAMGLSSSGSSIGAVIFPLVFDRLEPRLGFGWTTRVLAFILLSTSLIPLAVMNFPRSDIGDSTRDSRIEARPNGFAHFYAKLVDTSALQDRPFLLLVCGLLGTFMGIYTIQYYITLFALQETSTADHLSSAVLMIINGASTVGRILPSAIADQIGPVHVLAATALSSCLICFCMRTVHNSVGIIIWAVAFGCTTGAFMALPAAGVVSVSKTRGNIGARLGMTLGTVGCGVLVAEPIAGAILDFENGGWLGLIAWSGSLLSFGGLMVVVARVIKLGWKSRGIV